MPFTATSPKRPLPLGWNDTINADPELLLKRDYDKVIHISRDEIELCKALAKYHRDVNTYEDAIRLAFTEPNFFRNIKKKRDKLEKEVEIIDPRFLKITLFEWNNFTVQTFNKLLDFLEFPKERNVLLLVAKPEGRNFEGFSCDQLPQDYPVCKRIQKIREEG